MKHNKFYILCKSEIKGKFVPTAHPSFDSAEQAGKYAAKNIRTTEFCVVDGELKAALGF